MPAKDAAFGFTLQVFPISHSLPSVVSVMAVPLSTTSKSWKPPRDPERSFKTRTEGIVRKAIELANLDSRVAVFVERQGKIIHFKTHDDFVPDWTFNETVQLLGPGDVNYRPNLVDWDTFSQSLDLQQQTPALSNNPDTIVVDMSSPQSATPRDEATSDNLELIFPSSEDFDTFNSITDDAPFLSPVLVEPEQPGSKATSPSYCTPQFVTSSTPTSLGQKRRRPLSAPSMPSSPTPSSGSARARKRARTSSWFD
ncbi:hypothetical protein QQS21_002086 [Conoideocrella luteorostrata]|uniref:MADS-box domain-containing protein n=1 Tax=Conoideocrella luteorostrata TaxID=1105319 RepID=A0AAJ0G1F1_9HYPO|nr:hypothetical protein QQS21_002086 [Conoideocrella luteorostrata]